MSNNSTATNQTNNGTGIERVGHSPEVDVVAMVFFCILSVMIVFGNSLVIGAFRVNRRLRTKTNLLLVSLAIADLLIGTISVPLWVYISGPFSSNETLGLFYKTFDIICGVSSILNLTAISLERCYALLQPIKHRNIRKRVILAIIFVAWLFASVGGSMAEFLGEENGKYYGIIVTVTFFFLPLIVILSAYGTIFHIARAHARGRGVSSFKKDLRIATTVAVVIGLYVICWSPFFALNFTFSICATVHKKRGCIGVLTIPPTLLSIFKWLQYGNSVCNPIVYGLRNRDFRRAFRKILLRMCCKKVRLDDFSKSTYGRTVRATRLRRDSSFENSRSVISPPTESAGMFDVRDSYRKAIQSGRSKPIKLKFSKKTLADGILAMNVDAFHRLPTISDSTSTATLVSSSPETSASPAEHCNPALEDDHEGHGIYPISPAKDSNGNNTGAAASELKNSPKGSLQNGETRVRFKDTKDQENGTDLKSGVRFIPSSEGKQLLSSK